MATASPKFLPFGKQYHIFFFHGPSERDSDWTRDVIEQLEAQRYIGGCNCFDFSPHFSIFSNIKRVLHESVVLAFVFSHDSTKLEDFLMSVDNAVTSILRRKRREKQVHVAMIPVLLDDCEVSQCLINYEPLIVSNERYRWWPKLMNVLDIENPSSSSGESDEDLKYHFECMVRIAENDIKKQRKLDNMMKEYKIGYYTSQIGRRTTAKNLSEGCGIQIASQSLVIEWDTFVNIMSNSEKALIEIRNLSKHEKIENIVINLTKEGENKLFKYCAENRNKLVKFLEHSLNYDFHKSEYDRMTYNVKFQGHTGYNLLHLANNIVRNLYLSNYQRRTIEFNSLKKRIRTFENSPYHESEKNMLAEAGFIYSGVSDTITCHCCNQSLIGRFETDSESELYFQHSKWNTDCQYLSKKYSFPEYDDSSNNPYLPPTLSSIQEREEYSLTKLQNKEFAAELAKLGFVARTATLKVVLVICTSCHYEHCVLEDVNVMKDLQINHMIWSGKDCPFLVQEKGVSAISNFMRERELKVHHRSSIVFDPILMKRNP